MRVAILVDGDFFLHRFNSLAGQRTGAEMAAELRRYCIRHVSRRNGERLYRIFFYDCPPLERRAHNPISGRAVNFSATPKARFRRELHEALKSQPDVALRLGRLDAENARWTLKDARMLQRLLKREITVDQLDENDCRYYAEQKGVDMRIGVDIAAMAYKRQVERIILVAGDSDFVPAAKVARREGINFTLDPMWNPIKRDLTEHIDALRSKFPRPAPDKS